MQFLKIPNSILQMDLQPAEKMLLAYLKGYKAKKLYMTNQKIARDLNINIKSIERSLAKLRKRNLIQTNHEGRKRIITLNEGPQIEGHKTLKMRDQDPQIEGPASSNTGSSIYNNNIIDNNIDNNIDTDIDTNKDIRVIEEKSELYITHTRAHAHVDYILNKLANFYPSKFKKMSLDDKKTLVTVWRETFKAESQEDLESAFLSYTARARFFPYPAEFKKEVDSHRQAREFQKEQEKQNQRQEPMTKEEKAKSDALLADLMEVFGHDTK